MVNLPKGWEMAPLTDFCERLVDGSHNPPKASDVGRPMLSARNINHYKVLFDNYRLISDADFEVEDARTKIEPGNVLITIVGTIGRTAVVLPGTPIFALQRSVAVIKPLLIKSFYLAYALDSPEIQQWLHSNAKGTAQKGVYLKTLGSLSIPIAPLAEQVRIVEKLDELLSDLDFAVNEVKAAQHKVALYRHSLLKAATEGELTAKWREKIAPQGSGNKLLDELLTARRSLWEQTQLTKFSNAGKDAPNGWRSKYPEPLTPDTTGLPELPAGWVWASVDCFLRSIETGKSFKCLERPPMENEVGVVKVSAVSWGEFNEIESKTCTSGERVSAELFINKGDFLFSRANTVELVGACVIAKSVNLKVMLSDKILRFVFVQEALKPWLLYLLRSRVGRRQIELMASGNQESMKNIGQQLIRRIAVPIASRQEIDHITDLVEKGLEDSNRLQAANKDVLEKSVAQRKIILKTAFSGKLVPQDPNDESARSLLKAIKIRQDTLRVSMNEPRSKKLSLPMQKTNAEAVRDWISKFEEGSFTFNEIREAVPADYEVLKESIFNILAEKTPMIEQFFNRDNGRLEFKRKKA